MGNGISIISARCTRQACLEDKLPGRAVQYQPWRLGVSHMPSQHGIDTVLPRTAWRGMDRPSDRLTGQGVRGE